MYITRRNKFEVQQVFAHIYISYTSYLVVRLDICQLYPRRGGEWCNGSLHHLAGTS